MKNLASAFRHSLRDRPAAWANDAFILVLAIFGIPLAPGPWKALPAAAGAVAVFGMVASVRLAYWQDRLGEAAARSAELEAQLDQARGDTVALDALAIVVGAAVREAKTGDPETSARARRFLRGES